MFFRKSALVLALSLGAARAGNVHFDVDGVEKLVSVNDNGFFLEAVARVAGAPTSCDCDVYFTLYAEGESESTCYNNGGKMAPGQNPVPLGSQSATMASPAGNDAGGNTISPLLSAGWDGDCCLGRGDPTLGCRTDTERCLGGCFDCQVGEDMEYCPNGNWNEYVQGVSYTRLVIDAELDANPTREAERIVCTFEPGTENGDNTPPAADCTTCQICRGDCSDPYDPPAMELGCDF